MLWISTYSSIPSRPYSRPRPDCLKPPNGPPEVERVLVDRHVAAADPPRHVLGALDVRAPDAARQPVVGVVGDRDRVVLVVVRDDGDDGSEDLLPRDRHPVVDVGEDRRLHEVAARRGRRPPAAEHQPRALRRGPWRCSPRPARAARRLMSGPMSTSGSAGSPTWNAPIGLAQRVDDVGRSARARRQHAGLVDAGLAVVGHRGRRERRDDASRSASGSTIAADLPPSSRLQRLSCSPHSAAIRRPARVLPVKLILSTSGCLTRLLADLAVSRRRRSARPPAARPPRRPPPAGSRTAASPPAA